MRRGRFGHFSGFWLIRCVFVDVKCAAWPVKIGGEGSGMPGQPLFEQQGHILVDGAGMRFFLLDPKLRQHIDDRAGLDFQFASQLVDANLLHS